MSTFLNQVYNLFDPTPLTQRHLILGGIGFLLVYLTLAIILTHPARLLRPVPKHPTIYFAGVVLASLTAFLAFLQLDNDPLRFGLIAATFLILLVGLFDEQYSLTPGAQLFWQTMIAAVVVFWGWRITYISHPFSSGQIRLDQFTLGPLVWPGSILTIVWLLLLINAINWLDGLDGLATAVSMIALLTLSLLTLLPSVQDSQTLTLTLLGTGVTLGFLLWNFPPARVYLGTTGSWFLGLYIGLVAILTGGKIVTTLLVLAIPVIDLFFVIIQRLVAGRSPWIGDRTSHLHYRLLKAGLKPSVIVIMALITSFVLGASALTLQTHQKIIAFFASVFMFGIISLELLWRARQE